MALAPDNIVPIIRWKDLWRGNDKNKIAVGAAVQGAKRDAQLQDFTIKLRSASYQLSAVSFFKVMSRIRDPRFVTCVTHAEVTDLALHWQYDSN
jgi:hypothetical protein